MHTLFGSFTGLSPSLAQFSKLITNIAAHFLIRVQNPQEQVLGFGLIRFRSPLLTESLRFLFLRLLRCFTSAGIALTGLFNSTGSNWV